MKDKRKDYHHLLDPKEPCGEYIELPKQTVVILKQSNNNNNNNLGNKMKTLYKIGRFLKRLALAPLFIIVEITLCSLLLALFITGTLLSIFTGKDYSKILVETVQEKGFFDDIIQKESVPVDIKPNTTKKATKNATPKKRSTKKS